MHRNQENLAERSIIARLMADPDLFAIVADEGITPDHFEVSETRRLFESIARRKANNEWFGQVSLSQEFPELSGMIHALMSEEYHGELSQHTAVLNERVEQRTTIEALSALLRKVGMNPKTDLATEFSEILKAVAAKDHSVCASISMAEALDRLDEVVALRKANQCGLPTGIKRLDSHLNGGLQSPQLIVIGARPGHGKTTLAIQIALEASNSVPVGFITVEMASDDLAASALSAASKIDSRQIRNGTYDIYAQEVAYARKKLAGLPVRLYESNGLFDRALLECRRMVKRHGCKLIILDYLQIMRAPGRGRSRLEELAYMSAALKCLAVELKIPIVACAQLNRQVESRKDDEPRLSDLRESGSIEQDADAVILLRKHAMDSTQSAVSLHLAKNRRGLCGIIDCSGDYSTGRIWSI